MSEKEQASESNDAELFDDKSEQVFDESDDGLDALLDEIGSESEPLEENLDVLPESDDSDDFGDLISLPEVDDELDLAVGDGGDPVAEEAETVLTEEEAVDELLAEEEPVEELQIESEEAEAESTERPMNSDPLAEVAAIAAERNAEVAKKTSVMGGMAVQLALAGVAILALIAAIFASWQAFSSASRVEELTVTIQALQQREPVATTSPSADEGAVRADLDKVMAHVNEMAATLDGSLVELRDKNETALAAMQERLDKLEKVKTTSPVAAVKPVVEKAAATTPPPAAVGGWSVNLISLSNDKDAEQELQRLRNLGIRAEQQRVEQDGRVWFRLRVPGFTSRDGAMAYVKTVEDKAGVTNAWVGKN